MGIFYFLYKKTQVMNLDNLTNLKEMRVLASISQAEMSKALDVSQSQISRYEENPDDVPMKILKKWAEICGFLEGKLEPLNVGHPYSNIENKRKYIYDQLSHVPVISETSPGIIEVLNTRDIISNINQISRKPRLGVFGHFDMGKSRLCNVLLGDSCLPTRYQPTTSVACILRHISDKPSWQVEDVWMMDKDFDIHKINDEQHCKDHRVKAGNLASLESYVTHQDAEDLDSHYALLYIDSPILLACDLVDMPGYENDEKDSKRAELATTFVDIVLYLSTTQGFLGKNDLDYIGSLINVLPSYESEKIKSLDNLFILATRADVVENQNDRVNLLDKAAKRAFRHLEYKFEERGATEKITEEYFRSRFFTFSADKKILRTEFEKNLVSLLQDSLPDLISEKFHTYFQENFESLYHKYKNLTENLDSILNQREQMKVQLDVMKEDEKNDSINRKHHKEKILKDIQTYKNECISEVRVVTKKYLTVDYIESMIQSRYEDKKEAQQLAASYLSDSIQFSINKKVKEKSTELSKQIDALLREYDKKQNFNQNIKLDFDSKSIFMGAVAGLSTFGALATWASIVAAGSNLGAYLLVPTVVSFLSSIGISVGGTAAAASIVAALGGPITIGIGIAVVMGGIFAWLTGSSWQKKIAKRLVDLFEKENFETKLVDGISTYWNDTSKAFEIAADKTEKKFQDEISNLENSINTVDDDTLKEHKDYYTALSFFIKNLTANL